MLVRSVFLFRAYTLRARVCVCVCVCVDILNLFTTVCVEGETEGACVIFLRSYVLRNRCEALAPYHAPAWLT